MLAHVYSWRYTLPKTYLTNQLSKDTGAIIDNLYLIHADEYKCIVKRLKDS